MAFFLKKLSSSSSCVDLLSTTTTAKLQESTVTDDDHHPHPNELHRILCIFDTTMKPHRSPSNFLIILLSLLVFCCFSLYYTPQVSIYNDDLINQTFLPTKNLIGEDESIVISRLTTNVVEIHGRREVTERISSVAVLFPDWEVVLLVWVETSQVLSSGQDLRCLFPNRETSPVSFAGVLPFTNQTALKCLLPPRSRRRKTLSRPILTSAPEDEPMMTESSNLLRWNNLAFDVFSTEEDIVLFVKGVNRGHETSHNNSNLRCVFGDGSKTTAIRTVVTSSIQEVFRCHHPDLTAVENRTKVSLEIVTEQNERVTIPSVAYYNPKRKISKPQQKSLICANSMVYNVAKFLKEWVIYHSKIGVDKFILYDNQSDDDLHSTVKELNELGYNVNTLLWIWPKTQEAGFSHAAIYANDSCTWMMYLDVDEFLFSPSWKKQSQPSNQMLKSLLPSPSSSSTKIGQVSIKCNDFGPSNQTIHPTDGVTQGYTCRRSIDERHKSIVLLKAIEHTLYNAVHHFGLKNGYETRLLSRDVAVVNHYKYQAWSEFRNKFRRRVSAYVVDWTRVENLNSKDRTPGLGYQAVEPHDWAHKFCEVVDERLKILTRQWFGSKTENNKLIWQI